MAVFTQPPWPSQALAVRQAVTGQVYAIPLHTPAALRTSPLVQGLPSSHAAPALGVTVQVCVPLHMRSANWSLTQLMAVPVQTPLLLQASPHVQSMSSLQGDPGCLSG